jgi:hypothetical protein
MSIRWLGPVRIKRRGGVLPLSNSLNPYGVLIPFTRVVLLGAIRSTLTTPRFIKLSPMR